ncbi:MAG: hypothetical protein AB7T49_10560 [Oligoflexales bacterium]
MKIASVITAGMICFASVGFATSQEQSVHKAALEKFALSDEVTNWEDVLGDELNNALDAVSEPQVSTIEMDCSNFSQYISCVHVVSVFETFNSITGKILGRVVAKYLVETTEGSVDKASEISVVGKLVRDKQLDYRLDPRVKEVAAKAFAESKVVATWEHDTDEELGERDMGWDNMTQPVAQVIEKDCFADGACIYFVSVVETFDNDAGQIVARIVGKYAVHTDTHVHDVRELSITGSIN